MTPRHIQVDNLLETWVVIFFIQLTLIHDLELRELTKGAIVPEGGVKENNIPTVLLCFPRNLLSNHECYEDLECYYNILMEIFQELLPRPSNNTTYAASEEERRPDSEI